MMRHFPLGQHELRIFAVEPVLFYVRFAGDLTAAQARSLVRLLGPELRSGGIRFLVDASALGALGPDSRRELMTGGAEPHPWPRLVADIILVGASMLQKVVLAHIVSAASQYQEFSGQTHFFESMDDALLWLEVPASLLASAAAV